MASKVSMIISKDLFPTTSSLLSQPLSYTLKQLGETFGHAINLTLSTFVEWVKVFVKLFAFLMHFVLLIWPYIVEIGNIIYQQWILLSRKSQIIIFSIVAFIIFSFWMKHLFIKHKYLHRIEQKYKCIKNELRCKYQRVIYMIQSKSMKLAMLFPHLLFFVLFLLILYFIEIKLIEKIDDVLFVFVAFLYPFIKTYQVLQENNANSNALRKDDEKSIRENKSKTIGMMHVCEHPLCLL